MWWGGEDEDPPSGGSSSDNTTPPVDIMEDEASGLSPTSGSVISGDLEIPELKEQFAMQESLLGKLTSALKSNEEKLHLKEKEVQVHLKFASFILISRNFFFFSSKLLCICIFHKFSSNSSNSNTVVQFRILVF